MPNDSIVDVAIHAETLDTIRTLIRAELRRCGLRPPSPPGLGAWRWSTEADDWIAGAPPDSPAGPPASPSV